MTAHSITVVGTVLAAVAAIGGLWAQAVATYWNQQTAKDQLEQSREDSERERRAQAARVTFWIDERDSRPHFVNSSSDPIVGVYFHVGRESNGRYVATYALPALPPCTEVILDEPGLDYEIARHSDQGDLQLPPDPKATLLSWPSFIGPLEMAFVDRAGIRWVKGLTAPVHEVKGYDHAAAKQLSIDPDVKIHEVDRCDGGVG